jgi:N-acetylglucosaminyldiphosphoundecaprenol N-acetyl-beta-D-mannosaminyltransferase
MYLPYGDATWEMNDAAAPLARSAAALVQGGLPADRNGHAVEAARGPADLPAILLSGVRIHAVTEAQAIAHILDELDAGNGGTVVTPNLDHLRRCRTDVAFASIVAEANLVLADGMPVVWASKVQGTRLPQRVAGSDLISTLSAAAATRGRSIFLLGGMPGHAEGAAKILIERSNGTLNVAGTYCPPVGFENDKAEMARITSMLRESRPDIVYVALGSPKQEFLIDRIWRILPRAWWLGVGISFSFLTGDVKRAPKWMRLTGLEWLHRVYQEPKRLFKRYFVDGVPFAARLMINAGWTRCLRALRVRTNDGYAPSLADDPKPAVATLADATVARTEAPRPPEPTAGIPTTPASVAGPSVQPADATHGANTLGRLRAMVLLGGSVRSTSLQASIGRSVLDLPLDENGTILNHWLQHASDLARHIGLEKLPVRITVNLSVPEPVSASPRYAGMFTVERDLSEYRGTGGLLRDLAAGYDDDDLLLVCHAQQVLLDPLPVIAWALSRKNADFSLIAHRDGTTAGIMLMKCKALRGIQEVGFCDLKEQALPEIAKSHDVRAVQTRRPTGLSVRTLEDYLAALRLHHRRRDSKRMGATVGDPLAEDLARSFALVEAGADVDDTAYVHDAVVLRGARLGANSAAVRSLVCPGTVVRPGQQVVDTLCRPDRSR